MASKWDDLADSVAQLDSEMESLDSAEGEEFSGDITDVSEDDLASAQKVREDENEGSGVLYDPPALKMADAANLRDIHPFLGYAWRELDAGLRRDALVWLREWVDWFAVTYKVDKSLLPGCWFLHSDVVEYLWVAANAEVKSWHNPDASLTPFTSWHSYLPALKDRLNGGSQKRCRDGVHSPESAFGSSSDPYAVEVDEWAWQKCLNEISDEQEVQLAGRWRAVVQTKDGTVIRSEEVEVPLGASAVMQVEKPVLSFSGEGKPVVSVRFSGDDLARSHWEVFDELNGEWIVDESSVLSLDTDGQE